MMTVNNFAFNPTDGLLNAATYPTKPANENAARQQIQEPLNQLRDFINNSIVPSLFTGAGLTGATAVSRYVGATVSGAPVSGTFAKGDFVIDQSGAIWVCNTAGTPGTWTKVGAPANTATLIIGTYTGDGTTDRLISVGVAPKLVWVTSSTHYNFLAFPESATNISGSFVGLNQSTAYAVNMLGDQGGAGGANNSIRIRAASNGFLTSGNAAGQTNQTGTVYKYYALT